jgi:hypothetical protein
VIKPNQPAPKRKASKAASPVTTQAPVMSQGAPELRPGANGGKLKTGNKGNKGGGNPRGRPPNEFKARLAELCDWATTGDFMQRCLEGKEGAKAFLGALQFCRDGGYGKVPTTTKIEGDELAPLVVRVVRS